MKRITAAWAVLGLTLALAGCDKVLEAFYPEFKTGAGGTIVLNFAVDVSVTLDKLVVYTADFQGGKKVQVRLVPFYRSGEGTSDYYVDLDNVISFAYSKSDLPASAVESNGWRMAFSPTESLLSAQWRCIAWLDRNGDLKIDYNEPSALATTEGGADMIDLRYGLKQDWSVKANLDPNTRIDQWILEQVQPGGQSGTNQAPTAQISDEYPRVWQMGQQLFLDGNPSYDADGWVARWKWTVVYRGAYGELPETDPANNRGTFEGPTLSFTFADSGYYDVNLVVWDNQDLASASKAKATIQITAGAVQQTQINITGQNQTGQFPVRFALVEDFTKGFANTIDTWSSPFNNMFPNLMDGDYFIVAWVDADGDWMIDPTEPAATAENTSVSTPATTTGGVHLFHVVQGTTLNASVDLTPASVLPDGLFTTSGTEEANNTSYSIDLSMSLHDDWYTGTVETAVGANRDFIAYFDDPWGMHIRGPFYGTMDSSGTAGIPNLTGTPVQYHPYPGQDQLYVLLDMDASGDVGTGDFEAFMDVSLLTTDGGVAQVVIADADWWKVE